MVRIFKVFIEPKSFMRNPKNRWQVRLLNAIAPVKSMQSDADGEYFKDCIFRNLSTRVTLDSFIGFVFAEGQKIFMIWVSRLMSG